MIRVLVVEDETPILRDICGRIEKVGGGEFEVVATASNGREAIEKLAEVEPDLAFIDINLPILSGIEVLEYVREKSLDVVTVILSGYKNFEYAKQACALNVSDYLLKPLGNNELRDFLHKVQGQLKEKGDAGVENRLRSALQGHPVPASANREAYYVWLVYAGGCDRLDDVVYADADVIWRELDLRGVLEKHLPKDSFWVVDGQEVTEQLVFSTTKRATDFRLLREVFERLQNTGKQVSLASHKNPVTMGQLRPTYRRLQEYLRQNLVFCRPAILSHSGETPKTLEREAGSREVELAVAACLGDSRAAHIAAELDKLLCRAAAEPTRLVEVHYRLKLFFNKLCAQLPSNKDYFAVEQDIEFVLHNNYELAVIQKQMRFLVEECFGSIAIPADKNTLVAEIQDYLEANYQHDISNQILADRFGFVASYISSLFKAHYGKTPGEYVVALRMEKAKDLIIHSDCLMREISGMVGYADPLYFSRVFKRVVGVSPSKYLTQNRPEAEESEG